MSSSCTNSSEGATWADTKACPAFLHQCLVFAAGPAKACPAPCRRVTSSVYCTDLCQRQTWAPTFTILVILGFACPLLV